MKVKIREQVMESLDEPQKYYAKEVVAFLKKDMSVKSYAKMVTSIVCECAPIDVDVIKAEAEVIKKAFGSPLFEFRDGIDVWIEATSYVTLKGYYEVGFFLSDVWKFFENPNLNFSSKVDVQHYKVANDD